MSVNPDPISRLSELRIAVIVPSSEAEVRARDAMFARRRARRGPLLAIAAASVVAAVAIVAAVAPWGGAETAAAAIDELTETAAAQTPAKIGPHDWIVTKYTTERTWSQNLTQEKLDAMSARAAAVMSAANSGGHLLRSDNTPASKSVQDLADRANERHLKRVRAGVKLSELPATHISARNTASYVMARTASGIGGGGGGNNVITYDSPEQKAAGKILQLAAIGGNRADPEDFGGSEIAQLPLRAVSNEFDVEKLSTDLTKARSELAKWKTPPGIDSAADSPGALFAKASGLVSSPYAMPEQRATVIRLVAALPGVKLEREARDAKGREGVGMEMAIRGGKMQLVFDTQSSQLFGMLVTIEDPAKFVGDSYAGSGKSRVKVVPPFDSATIAVSFDPWTISHGKPPCTPSFCMNPSPEQLDFWNHLPRRTSR
jgi:hypothetical protein